MIIEKVKVLCLSCKKEMLVYPSRLADGRGKYCSRACAKNGYNAKAKRAASRKNGHHRFIYQEVAEKILGRPLKRGEVVHHKDGNHKNNDPSNLIVCSQSDHIMFHAQQRALKATGNINAKKCVYCKKWDLPENMILHSGKSNMRHKGCYSGRLL